MKFTTAVEHVRMVAEACAEDARRAPALGRSSPWVRAAYVLGDLLDGPDEIDGTEVCLVVDEPAAAMPWGQPPAGAGWFEDVHRINRHPIQVWYRPRDVPVVNHVIRRPVQIFDAETGVAHATLDTLQQRHLEALERVPDPPPDRLAAQLADEAAVCLRQLTRVVDRYWDPEWRRDHRGLGHYPEHHLYWAAWGYADLERAIADLAASQGSGEA